jgi:hypothetical protein
MKNGLSFKIFQQDLQRLFEESENLKPERKQFLILQEIYLL